LTRSKLPSEPNITNNTVPEQLNCIPAVEEDFGFQPCGDGRCYACKLHCSAGTTFRSSTRDSSHNIRDALSCQSTDIVYLITCHRCLAQYVGETGRTLAQRLTDHRSNIKLKKQTPIAIHFNSDHHSVADLRAVAIEKIRNPNRSIIVRRQREQFWQIKLGTKYPHGLNCMPVD
jgi:GIY-YIG catalytic domain